MIESTEMELTDADLLKDQGRIEAMAYDPDFLTAPEWGKRWGISTKGARTRIRKGINLGIIEKRRVWRQWERMTCTLTGYKVCGEIPIDHIFLHRGICWDSQPLGKITDRELSGQTGVSIQVISAQRAKRNIPPFDKSCQKKDVNWDSVPLGEYYDSTIAHILSVHPSAVGRQRKKRGIKPYSSQQGSEHV